MKFSRIINSMHADEVSVGMLKYFPVFFAALIKIFANVPPSNGGKSIPSRIFIYARCIISRLRQLVHESVLASTMSFPIQIKIYKKKTNKKIDSIFYVEPWVYWAFVNDVEVSFPFDGRRTHTHTWNQLFLCTLYLIALIIQHTLAIKWDFKSNSIRIVFDFFAFFLMAYLSIEWSAMNDKCWLCSWNRCYCIYYVQGELLLVFIHVAPKTEPNMKSSLNLKVHQWWVTLQKCVS